MIWNVYLSFNALAGVESVGTEPLGDSILTALIFSGFGVVGTPLGILLFIRGKTLAINVTDRVIHVGLRKSTQP